MKQSTNLSNLSGSLHRQIVVTFPCNADLYFLTNRSSSLYKQVKLWYDQHKCQERKTKQLQ